MSPRAQATAFRIWQHCQPLGWATTVADLARELELPLGTVRNIVRDRGWSNRLYATQPRTQYLPIRQVLTEISEVRHVQTL